MTSPGLPPSFEPLEKLTLGENIARHLQELLLNGSLRPGDSLPSQRELAQRYGTSVAAVREAISMLSAAGLIDARPGRGTVVLAAPQQAPGINLWLGAIHDEHEAQAFMDTRQVLEHYTIRQAARHATPDHLSRMRAALALMRDCGGDPDRFVRADLSLHFEIAAAAGNPVMTRMLHAIHTPLANLLRAVTGHVMNDGRFRPIFDTHQDIVDAIANRDPARAVRAFDAMLAESLQDDALAKVLGGGRADEAPLGPAFLEDLRWNLTRLIGPMSDVLIAETATEIGADPEGLTRRRLRPFLTAVAGQLPATKREEWRALADLLLARYDPA